MGYTLEDDIIEELKSRYARQRQILIKDISSRQPRPSILHTLMREEEHIVIPGATQLLQESQNKDRLLSLAKRTDIDCIIRHVSQFCNP